jgi:predicted short-subunit dehydrogenase-like oxidoreductase (DUF2520 family)
LPLVRIVGPGRAGTSLALALTAAGWPAPELTGRGADLAPAAHGVDLLVLATPDGVLAEVAGAVDPDPSTVVVHLAGSLGLDVLAPHPRRASVHPLVALPDPQLGAVRLRGAWFGVSRDGDPAALAIPAALGGRILTLEEDRTTRARYHAAACIASNHLVALLGQVERVAGLAGVPLDAYLDLVRATVDNVAALGPVAALTGPAARGDDATVARHLAVLPEAERPAYEVLVEEARRLRRVPACS